MTDPIATGTPEQLRAFAHPTRQRIWRELGSEGATVSQLAHRLPSNKGNVAHHLAVLVRSGLVRKGRTRTVRGGTEQYYERSAQRVRFGPGDGGSATTALLVSVAEELSGAPAPLLSHRTVRLTRQQATALARHLDRVVTELEPASEREATYGVLVSVYRR